MNIGIIGNGIVGRATSIVANSCEAIKLLAYDIRSELAKPSGTTMDDLIKSDIIFICVPTPMGFNGKCETETVTNVVQDLRSREYSGYIVIRSTVPPSTCRKLGCFYMPEFVTMNSYDTDFIEQTERIVGTNEHLPNNASFKRDIQKLFTTSKEAGAIKSDKLEFVSVEEAEIIKYTRNAFLATKISFFNEINSYCSRLGVSFDTVRKCTCLDNRIGDSHSQVPGPDGRYGFAGPELMKDLISFCMSLESANVPPLILRPVVGRNARKDRPDELWYKPPVENYTRENLNSFSILQLKDIVNRNE